MRAASAGELDLRPAEPKVVGMPVGDGLGCAVAGASSGAKQTEGGTGGVPHSTSTLGPGTGACAKPAGLVCPGGAGVVIGFGRHCGGGGSG